MFVALVSPGGIQNHPIRIETLGHGSTQPAVVGSQRGVVQTPVEQVIRGTVHIPGDIGRHDSKLHARGLIHGEAT